MRSGRLGVLALTALVAVACGADTESPAVASAGAATSEADAVEDGALDGTWWLLLTATDEGTPAEPLDHAPITLRFEGGRLLGDGGCNSYAAEYTYTDLDIQLGAIKGSEDVCTGAVGEAEELYLRVLAGVENARNSGDNLVMGGDRSILIFQRLEPVDSRGDLANTTWLLTAARNDSGQVETDARVTMTFDDDGLAMAAECGGLRVDFSVDSGSPAVGAHEETQPGCVVNEVSKAIVGASRIAFERQDLLFFGRHSVLRFRPLGAPAAEQLVRTTWTLERGTGPDGEVPMIEGFALRAEFSPEVVSVQGGCATVIVGFGVEGASINFEGDAEVIGVGCEPALQASGDAFRSAFLSADEIHVADDTLTLRGPSVELVLSLDVPIPLVDQLWLLTGLPQGGGLSIAPKGRAAVLRFNADGTLDGRTPCRALTGSYKIVDDTVEVSDLSAEGDCTDPMGVQADQIVDALTGSSQLEIVRDELVISKPGGRGLTFVAIEEDPATRLVRIRETFTNLSGAQWTLVSGRTVGGAIQTTASPPITIEFASETVTGVACGLYAAELSLEARFHHHPSSTFLSVSIVDTARCDDPEMLDAYTNALASITDVRLDGARLVFTGRGTELVFEPSS